ncbi:TonB-dependent receptor plug domain-containing protein [Isoalcanivorax beigongshangi]|uniref:TonB-dependent receptor plug domain-containing protein n=1 Tax=Isoalcanivorax beigongshangi TaxID=3238810 RepID=A0ABV4AGG0_9GAMM
MLKLKSLRPAAGCLLLFAGYAGAEALPVTDAPRALEPVLVTDDVITQDAARALAQRQNSVNATVVIGREQLAQFGDLALGDALRRIAGVSFPNPNRAREPRLRGASREYTQTLVDGRRLLDGSSDRSTELDRIPVSLVERVEIIRTPTAGMDGQGAAGTINVVLRRDIEQPAGSVQFSLGHHEGQGNIASTTVNQVGQVDRLSYALAVNLQRNRRGEGSDSYDYRPNGDPKSASLDRNGRRLDQVNVTPRLIFNLDQRELTLSPYYLRTREDRHSVGDKVAADLVTVNERSVEDRERIREFWGSHVQWQQPLAAVWDLDLQLDLQQGKEDTERNGVRYNASGAIDQRDRRDARIDLARYQASASVGRQWARHQLQLGTLWSQERREEDNAETRNGAPRPPNASRQMDVREDILAAWAESTWQPQSALRVNYGLRMERGETQSTPVGARTSKQDATELLPSASVAYRFHPQWEARAGVARTLRRSDLRDLSTLVEQKSGTIAKPDKSGNPDVKPERIWGVDLGLDHYLSQLGGHVGINLFHRDVEDRIETMLVDTNGRWVSKPVNASEGYFQGVELEARVPVGDTGLTTWGNATFMRSRVKDPMTSERRRFSDQPDALYNVGLDYFIAPMNLTLGTHYHYIPSYNTKVMLADGGRRDLREESLNRLDFSARYAASRQFEISAQALNVTRRAGRSHSTVFKPDMSLDSSNFSDAPSARAYQVAAVYHW